MEIYDFSYLVESKIKKNMRISLAIGVFEAFHKGHQAIIKAVLDEKEKRQGSESMVVTFSINPKPGRNGAIDTLRLREENLALYGIDCIATIDFSAQFSRISASRFLEMILSSMDLNAIAVGEDFQFGNPSESASAYDLVPMLDRFGSRAKVDIVAPILTEGGDKISSTLLRRMIKEGELEEFPKLSGRYYALDMLKSPCIFEDMYLVYRTEDVHQLLPPQGAYDCVLILENKDRIEAVASIEDSTIKIKAKGYVPLTFRNAIDPMFKAEKLLLERRK